MTALHETLVYDSEIGPLTNFVFFFSLACITFVFDQT